MAIGNPVSTTSSSVASKTSSVIATAGQTLFTVPAGYVTNHISVFRNGIRLVDGRDYEARNGATVTLLAAATVGDVIEFHVFDTFSVADAVTNQGGTIFGDLTVEGSIGNITGVAATFTGNVNVGGVLTYEDVTNIDSVGIITSRSDLSIADKIIHTGDTNTAIRFPAADTVTVETSGNEALRVNSSGEVSIGTVTGGKTLTLFGTSSSSFRISKSGVLAYDHTLDGSSYTIANNNGSGGIPLIIGTKTAGAESLRIDSDGNFGLGAAPTNYSGYNTLMHNASTGATFEQRVGGTLKGSLTTDTQVTLKSLTSIPLVFATANTERLHIDLWQYGPEHKFTTN